MERDRLLGGRPSAGTDLTPYLEALGSLDDGDVVAVAERRREPRRCGSAKR
jgi:hypothetical protein